MIYKTNSRKGLAATYNPGMSRRNRVLERGLASPLTWIEGVFGVESPLNMVSDASNTVASVLNSLTGAGSAIAAYKAQAQGFDGNSDATVRGKASSVEGEADGLSQQIPIFQSTASDLQNQINIANTTPGLTQAQAGQVVSQANTLQSQVSTFMGQVSQLKSDANSITKLAVSGPGLVATLENTALNSVSTLTWIIGGSLAAYFLLPTFLPRMVGGMRRARRS